MESAQVRIRPFRLAFLVEPRGQRRLCEGVFEMNSQLWGGVFNYIIPLFKTVPTRYKQKYHKQITAKAMIDGFIEAFKPDYVVETRDGQIGKYGVNFPEKRLISLELLRARDEQSRCQIGVDLRSVCHDMWVEQFQFVQRHGPDVLHSNLQGPPIRSTFRGDVRCIPGKIRRSTDLHRCSRRKAEGI